MLLPCPECGQQISDRAASCPACGFPIAQHLTSEREAKALETDRGTRAEAGEADCPHCEARGFVTGTHTNDSGDEKMNFRWCVHCEHSGRLALVKSQRGYWAVAHAQVTDFVQGAIDTHAGIVFIGTEAPDGHRYEKAGKRIKEDDES